MDPQDQLELFRDAVALLGGSRTAAARLGVAERTVTRLLAGETTLHTGFLADMAKALLDHAEACRAMERRLSPAFADNLTEAQRTARPHGNAFHLGRNIQRQLREGRE